MTALSPGAISAVWLEHEAPTAAPVQHDDGFRLDDLFAELLGHEFECMPWTPAEAFETLGPLFATSAQCRSPSPEISPAEWFRRWCAHREGARFIFGRLERVPGKGVRYRIAGAACTSLPDQPEEEMPPATAETCPRKPALSVRTWLDEAAAVKEP